MRSRVSSGARAVLADAVLYGIVVCAGFGLVTTTWWFQDDWHFLANALGIAPRGTGLARFVSYELYWRALIGPLGTGAIGWAVTRLLIHWANALLVRAIAARLTGREASGFLAGLLFAASPLAFECLYWASGAVDLLGLFFVLLAVQLWLRSDRRITVPVILAAVAGVFSKESALAFLALLVYRAARDRRMPPRELAGVVAVLAAAAVAVTGLQRHMAAAGDYDLSWASVPRNLAIYGYWLVAPPPLMKSVALHSATSVGIGLGVWAAWIAAGAVLARRGNALPAQAGLAAFAVLVPSLLVGDHAVPRYVYAASPAFVVALVACCGGFGLATPGRKILAALLAAMVAWTTAAYQVDARWPNGRPLHRYVAKREIAVNAVRTLRQAPGGTARRIAFVVPARADRGEVSLLRDAIADDLAVRVMFGAGSRAVWVDRPEDAPPGAEMYAVEGFALRALGRNGP